MLSAAQVNYLVDKIAANKKTPIISLYELLLVSLRQMIYGGEFSLTQCLPSTRQLAKQLQVSRGTIESCYHQLASEGIIRRETGRGSFIALKQQPLIGSSTVLLPNTLSEKPKAVNLSKRGLAITNSAPLVKPYTNRAFIPGFAETRNFPFDIWQKLYEQVIAETNTTLELTNSGQGNKQLRHAISDYLLAERGVKASAQQILIVNSTQQALMLCAHVLLDAEDEIYIEEPCYPEAVRAFIGAQLKPIAISVDEEGIDVSAITSASKFIKAVYLTPSNQYPTGGVLSLPRRLAIIEWAQQNNTWIIEDDYDSEFHYNGAAITALQGLDPFERTIYLGTFNKTTFPALRLAYMVLPDALVEPMTHARIAMDGFPSPIMQLTLARFIEKGHFREHIRTMKQLYAARAEHFIKLLEQQLGPQVQIKSPSCGLQLLCLTDNSELEIYVCKEAEQKGIRLQAVSSLCQRKDHLYGWLMGFAALTPMEMDKAVKELGVIFQQYHQ